MRKMLIECDGCHELFEPEAERMSNAGTFTRRAWKEADSYDLCSRCADEVQKFISKGKKDA